MAAWDWALAHDDWATAWALSCGLGFLADRQGRNQEMARVLGPGAAWLRAGPAAQHGDTKQQCARSTMRAALLTNQCERLCRIGQLDDAAACLEEAESLLAAADPGDALWAEARWFCGRMMAWTRYERGDFAGSMALFHRLQEQIRARRVQIWPYGENSTTIWLTEIYELLGFNALALGEYDQARRLALEGIGIAEKQGLPYCRAWVSYPLIGALLSLGEYAQAEQVAQRFVNEARAFTDDLMITQATAMLGHAQAATGQHDRARATLRQALALAKGSGLRVIITGCLVGLGNLELAQGRLPAAQRYYEACFPAVPGHSAPTSGPAAALVGLGRVALGRGDPAEALVCFRQALAGPRRSAGNTAEALVYMAEALHQQGEQAQPAELCGFLLRWPGTPYRIREAAGSLVDRIEAKLPLAELTEALARGARRNVDEVVTLTDG